MTLALNSTLVKMQSERDAGGSIILHWGVGEIENVLVPLVDIPTQQKIAALIFGTVNGLIAARFIQEHD